ncbi:hypothetical protein M513_14257, partial [Trichuris suis]
EDVECTSPETVCFEALLAKSSSAHSFFASLVLHSNIIISIAISLLRQVSLEFHHDIFRCFIAMASHV